MSDVSTIPNQGSARRSPILDLLDRPGWTQARVAGLSDGLLSRSMLGQVLGRDHASRPKLLALDQALAIAALAEREGLLVEVDDFPLSDRGRRGLRFLKELFVRRGDEQIHGADCRCSRCRNAERALDRLGL